MLFFYCSTSINLVHEVKKPDLTDERQKIAVNQQGI